MADTTPDDEQAKEKRRLELEKLQYEVTNLSDSNLSITEKIMKKRVIPVFLPVLTLSATILFFVFNRMDNEKSKAFERYKNEVELVKIVWEDVNEDITPHSRKFRQAVDYLTKIDSSNKEIYRKDSVKIGIGLDKRPIALLKKIIPEFETKAANQDVKSKTPENLKKVDLDFNKPVVDQKTKTVDIIKSATKDSDLYTVYIQYWDKSNRDVVRQMEKELKYYYIVPGVEYVKSNYKNQIRYYRDDDIERAIKLQKKLKEITGRDFKLIKLDIPATNKTKAMEIWYRNELPSETAYDAAAFEAAAKK